MGCDGTLLVCVLIAYVYGAADCQAMNDMRKPADIISINMTAGTSLCMRCTRSPDCLNTLGSNTHNVAGGDHSAIGLQPHLHALRVDGEAAELPIARVPRVERDGAALPAAAGRACASVPQERDAVSVLVVAVATAHPLLQQSNHLIFLHLD